VKQAHPQLLQRRSRPASDEPLADQARGFCEELERNGDTDPPVRCQPRLTVCTHVDANPANGAFRLSLDFPAIGAGTKSRVLAPGEFGRIALAQGPAPGPSGGNNAREWWVVSKRERRRTGGLTSN
jgi:hypothetical protein